VVSAACKGGAPGQKKRGIAEERTKIALLSHFLLKRREGRVSPSEHDPP